MASFLRICVLLWADILALYTLWVMMTYLTDVWKLSVTHAAGILNIFEGSSAILPIVLAYLVGMLIGDFSMLLFSSLAYCGGFGFLWMSTPPVMGKCSEYAPECIGKLQKTLFYTALALLMVGIAGHVVSLKRFMETQLEEDGEADDEAVQRKVRFLCIGIFGVVLFPVIGGIALPYIKPWSLRFCIPAIFTVVATLVFLSGSCWYRHRPPQASPISSLIRVFVASASKLFHRSPADSTKLYETPDLDHQVPHSAGLRFSCSLDNAFSYDFFVFYRAPFSSCSCLEKAAVILPNQSLEQQERIRWRLCRVTEVEETKTIIRMIPMWVTYIMCGIVSSTGNTYFLEQAKNMNPKIGKFKVTLTITMLLMINDGAKPQFALMFSQCAGAVMRGRSRKYIPPVGIAVAMIFSVLGCITAAKVENWRVNVIIEHDLVDKPDERIPMTMFWLVPQFLLLGALDGIFEFSVVSFFKSHASPAMRNYLHYFTFGVIGLGKMSSVLTVYVSGMMSERGGKLNWFQQTLNKSRLDNYCWTLAALSAANLILYIVVALFYRFRESEEEEDEQEEENEDSVEPFEDNAQCCCCCCCCCG